MVKLIKNEKGGNLTFDQIIQINLLGGCNYAQI